MSNIYTKQERKCDEIATRDEYHTPMWVVETLLDPIKHYLKDKRVLCPCDTKDSAWVKWCVKNKIHVTFVNYNFREIPQSVIDKCDIVITTPPFSLKCEFLTKFKDKLMIILGMIFFMTTKLYSDYINASMLRIYFLFEGDYKIKKWANDVSGVMGIVSFSNIPSNVLYPARAIIREKIKDPAYKNYCKETTKQEILDYKHKIYNRLKKHSQQVDKYYDGRHNVYVNPQVWQLYKMQNKISINEILCWYFMKNR